MTSLDWLDRAACTGTDPELFYADRRKGDVQAALRICKACPVTAECLAAALATEGGAVSPAGIRGGLTPGKRTALRKAAGAKR